MHQQHCKLLECTDTSGNELRLEKAVCKYDLCKYYFTNLIVNIWNSLPTCWNHIALADSTDSLKSRLDSHWIISIPVLIITSDRQ